jgi:hypothetical protein
MKYFNYQTKENDAQVNNWLTTLTRYIIQN